MTLTGLATAALKLNTRTPLAFTMELSPGEISTSSTGVGNEKLYNYLHSLAPEQSEFKSEKNSKTAAISVVKPPRVDHFVVTGTFSDTSVSLRYKAVLGKPPKDFSLRSFELSLLDSETAMIALSRLTPLDHFTLKGAARVFLHALALPYNNFQFNPQSMADEHSATIPGHADVRVIASGTGMCVQSDFFNPYADKVIPETFLLLMMNLGLDILTLSPTSFLNAR